MSQQHLSRRTFVQLSAAGLCLPMTFTTHAEVALAVSINRAARFSALSQRSAKAYVQLVLNVLPDDTKKAIESTQRIMLSSFSPTLRSLPTWRPKVKYLWGGKMMAVLVRF